MTSFSTNAARIKALFEDRRAKWDAALAKAMRKAVFAVEASAVDFLTGSGAARGYPVPVRTGFLRRALGSKVESQTSGIVFNSAGYARAIHSGEIAVGFKGRQRKKINARPFLEDAMKTAQPGALIVQAMSAAL
jgi:hypothetical protein